jgi:hypothetical protein
VVNNEQIMNDSARKLRGGRDGYVMEEGMAWAARRHTRERERSFSAATGN